MLEKALEKKVRFWLEERGGMLVKLTNRAGIPDRLALLPNGRVLFIEFKKAGAKCKPRPLQSWWIARLETMGFEAFCSNDFDEIIARLGTYSLGTYL